MRRCQPVPPRGEPASRRRTAAQAKPLATRNAAGSVSSPKTRYAPSAAGPGRGRRARRGGAGRDGSCWTRAGWGRRGRGRGRAAAAPGAARCRRWSRRQSTSRPATYRWARAASQQCRRGAQLCGDPLGGQRHVRGSRPARSGPQGTGFARQDGRAAHAPSPTSPARRAGPWRRPAPSSSAVAPSTAIRCGRWARRPTRRSTARRRRPTGPARSAVPRRRCVGRAGLGCAPRGRAGARRRARRGGRRQRWGQGVLLDDDVGVGAAHPEGADAGPAGARRSATAGARSGWPAGRRAGRCACRASRTRPGAGSRRAAGRAGPSPGRPGRWPVRGGRCWP